MSLFIKKEFTMHSGGKGFFKIECDALTDEDIETLALLAVKTIERLTHGNKIRRVHGVPTGGQRFADAILPYVNTRGQIDLIVDDVLTTGGSMEEAKKTLDWPGAWGIVIFSRTGDYPEWITPLFTMPLPLDEAAADNESPYIIDTKIERVFAYNPNYGDHRICDCGHEYHRHFDSYPNIEGEVMEPIGCKYCECYHFKKAEDPEEAIKREEAKNRREYSDDHTE